MYCLWLPFCSWYVVVLPIVFCCASMCFAPLLSALVFVCVMRLSCVIASDFVVRVVCCCVLMLLCCVFVLLRAFVCSCAPFALLDCVARICVMARCAVFFIHSCLFYLGKLCCVLL